MKRPEVTVAAVIIRGNKILLTRRNVEPYRGRWCLPGGHVEFGEKVDAAIKREVKEETGLDYEPKFLGYFNEVIKSINWHAVVLGFYGKARGEEKRNKREIKEMEWFSLDRAKRLKFGFRNKEILIAALELICE